MLLLENQEKPQPPLIVSKETMMFEMKSLPGIAPSNPLNSYHTFSSQEKATCFDHIHVDLFSLEEQNHTMIYHQECVVPKT